MSIIKITNNQDDPTDSVSKLVFEGDNLYVSTPLPAYPHTSVFELVMTKEVFKECFKRWILNEEVTDKGDRFNATENSYEFLKANANRYDFLRFTKLDGCSCCGSQRCPQTYEAALTCKAFYDWFKETGIEYKKSDEEHIDKIIDALKKSEIKDVILRKGSISIETDRCGVFTFERDYYDLYVSDRLWNEGIITENTIYIQEL